jgi:uncharacterized repeat protein (TIGR01451 family)
VDAASDGDTIKVAQGVYTAPGFQVVYLTKALTVTGGYTLTDWIDNHPIAQPTIIDAENVSRRRGMYIDGTDVPAIMLDGLTIQHGRAAEDNSAGGGIYIVSGTVVVQSSRIISNSAEGFGGGLYIGGGNLVLENNLFQGNGAGDNGGGTYIGATTHVTISGNTFEANEGSGVFVAGYGTDSSVVNIHENVFLANSGGLGGGLYLHGCKGTVQLNIFQKNHAAGSGGGLFILSGESLTVHGNTVVDNHAHYGGGGIFVASGTPTLSHNSIQGNYAEAGGGICVYTYGAYTYADLIGNNIFSNTAIYGGGISVGLPTKQDSVIVTLRGNVVSGNEASALGGGLYISEWEGHEVIAENDIFAANLAPWEAVYMSEGTLTARHWTLVNNGKYALTTGSGTAILHNTIVASHSVGGFAGAGITADHTLFFNSGTPCTNGAACTNNLFGAPRFVNPVDGDYHIGPGSAAIDAGVDAGVTEDIDGEPRPMGPGYDIGADEAGLVVVKRATPYSVRPGGALTYTLQVANFTSMTLHATVTDTLPSGVVPPEPSVWTDVISAGGGIWTQVIATAVDEDCAGPLTNMVKVTTDEGLEGMASVTTRCGYFIHLPLVLRYASW